MGRPVVLSNGSMMVGLNEQGLVQDFYFPYIGQENLTNARLKPHLVGVWVDNQFAWLDSDSWKIDVNFEADALVSRISAQSDNLQAKLEFADFVDYHYNAFCRRVKVTNLSDQPREIRLFFHQVFMISRRGRADTVLYVPEGNYLYDYKGRCALLIGAECGGQPFDQFSVGNFGIEGKEGTYMDAEDGELSGNLVEHGSVDSVIRCQLKLEANASEFVDYWIVASFSQHDAESVHNSLRQQGLHSRLDQTRADWRDWLAIAKPKTDKIEEKYRPMFQKSLMLVKAHIDKRGGMIASGDSSIYNYGRDYYSYVWPRDGALTMLSLIRAGYHEEPKRFFEFCMDTIDPHGYMMHKYQPDRSIGSTWHPLMHRHHPELAIQEDETAAVVYALCEFFKAFPRESKFVKPAFDTLINPAANFMARFIDEQTGLPHASYDLWEERFGTYTYSVLSTIAALKAAAELAEGLSRQDSAELWRQAAAKIEGHFDSLYNPELGCYRKGLYLNQEGKVEYDDTVDSSAILGFLEFAPDKLTDNKFQASLRTIRERLFDKSPSGGMVRYEHDNYFLAHQEYLGNPWIICTLWLAQARARAAQPEEAKKMIDWALNTASPSGTLAEQVDPVDGRQVGVSPLVWSHCELVNTLLGLYT